jgi:hypothetical protein
VAFGNPGPHQNCPCLKFCSFLARAIACEQELGTFAKRLLALDSGDLNFVLNSSKVACSTNGQMFTFTWETTELAGAYFPATFEVLIVTCTRFFRRAVPVQSPKQTASDVIRCRNQFVTDSAADGIDFGFESLGRSSAKRDHLRELPDSKAAAIFDIKIGGSSSSDHNKFPRTETEPTSLQSCCAQFIWLGLRS